MEVPELFDPNEIFVRLENAGREFASAQAEESIREAVYNNALSEAYKLHRLGDRKTSVDDAWALAKTEPMIIQRHHDYLTASSRRLKAKLAYDNERIRSDNLRTYETTLRGMRL